MGQFLRSFARIIANNQQLSITSGMGSETGDRSSLPNQACERQERLPPVIFVKLVARFEESSYGACQQNAQRGEE